MIKIDREERSISIWNGTLKLTPREAVQLMEALNARAREIYDLASYYSCDCGQVHHNSVKICPRIGI